MFVYEGMVVKSRGGNEYLVTSTRGTVNLKGRKIENGVVTNKMYQIPRSGVESTRDLSYAENVSMVEEHEKTAAVRLGAVVTFKHTPKDTAPGEKFVVFKENDDTVNVVKLGGDDNYRYFRSVPKGQLNLVEM